MNVLVACEFSDIVASAFRRQGHLAFSCDLRPCEQPAPADSFYGFHIQGDVLNVLAGVNRIRWDLMIAHPPCTYLTNAGVRWMYKGGRGKVIDPKRRGEMLKAAVFFNALLSAPIPRICVENPIQHCFARVVIREYDQIIQPWQFGHAETKATCLWRKNLPPLIPTDIIQPDFEKYPPGKGNGFEPRVHYESPGKKGSDEREKNRSRTLVGVANAMAAQWNFLA